jgi:hypothetical protein
MTTQTYKSVALNKIAKESIYENITKNLTAVKNLEASKRAVDVVIDKVLDDVLGKHKKAYESLPEAFKETREEFEIRTRKGETFYVPYCYIYQGNFRPRTQSLKYTAPKKRHSPYYQITRNQLDAETNTAVDSMDIGLLALYTDIVNKSKAVWEMLEKVKNTKQLLEVFPEVIGYLPTEILQAMRNTNLPAVILPYKEAKEVKTNLSKPLLTTK